MTEIPSTLAAALSGRYTIERKLGEGGMAVVYLAQDLKHGRTVAIKVLREDVAQTLGAERFLREIRLAAKLSHPHILPLYDSGDVEKMLYFVMPNVEGASLRDRLDQVKLLPVDEAVRIASEVAGALDYAHRHNVVHRDIKPENIMLHEGHALVADFGIGKALSAVEGQAFTKTGMSVGTPAYMSPEQAAGDTVDGRSDLYSLGCVLYEMLVGEQPFTGATVQAVIAKRFVQTPADVTALREGVPRPVARAVQKALARVPIDRYETGALLVTSLSEIEKLSATAPAPEKSLAVLPFANMSTDPENEFFADGITEEILNALAAIPDLRVAGRTSSFSFKGKNQELKSIGEQLNVRTVLEGSVRRSGKRVRITAQLSDVTDGFRLWSERYDREIEDVFAVQDEIATAIAEKLKTAIKSERGTTLEQRSTPSIEAYEAYLKGRALFYRRGTAIREGMTLMERAVELDPEFALAWAGLADGHSLLGYYGVLAPEVCAPAARAAAAKALEFGPDLAEAHNARAQVALLFDWEWVVTERSFRRALELNPTYLQASAWYGLFFLGFVSGRWDEAVDFMKGVQRNEPLSAYAAGCLTFCLGYGDRGHEAVEWGERACQLDSTSFLSLWALQTALYFDGQFAAAISTADRLLNYSGRHHWSLVYLAAACARSGDQRAVRAIHAELTARVVRDYISPFLRGIVAALAGDAVAAMDLAREAIDRRDPSMPVFLRWAKELPEMRSLVTTNALSDAIRLPGRI
jgi:serine/threonine-protein kinase